MVFISSSRVSLPQLSTGTNCLQVGTACDQSYQGDFNRRTVVLLAYCSQGLLRHNSILMPRFPFKLHNACSSAEESFQKSLSCLLRPRVSGNGGCRFMSGLLCLLFSLSSGVLGTQFNEHMVMVLPGFLLLDIGSEVNIPCLCFELFLTNSLSVLRHMHSYPLAPSIPSLDSRKVSQLSAYFCEGLNHPS